MRRYWSPYLSVLWRIILQYLQLFLPFIMLEQLQFVMCHNETLSFNIQILECFDLCLMSVQKKLISLVHFDGRHCGGWFSTHICIKDLLNESFVSSCIIRYKQAVCVSCSSSFWQCVVHDRMTICSFVFPKGLSCQWFARDLTPTPTWARRRNLLSRSQVWLILSQVMRIIHQVLQMKPVKTNCGYSWWCTCV